MQVFWTLRLKATQVSRNMIKGNQSYFNYRVFISWVHTVLLNLRLGRKLNHRWLGRWLAPYRRTRKLAIFKFSQKLKLQDFLCFTRNSRAAGGPHSLISLSMNAI